MGRGNLVDARHKPPLPRGRVAQLQVDARFLPIAVLLPNKQLLHYAGAIDARRPPALLIGCEGGEAAVDKWWEGGRTMPRQWGCVLPQ